jgi:hypothetical protein
MSQSDTTTGQLLAPGVGTRGRELEWGRRFAALTLAWLEFETLSSLAI